MTKRKKPAVIPVAAVKPEQWSAEQSAQPRPRIYGFAMIGK